LDVSTCISRHLCGLHVQTYFNSWELKFVRVYDDPSEIFLNKMARWRLS